MRIVITDYISIGSDANHNASSYQVALDPLFTDIIDESIEDRVNVKEWHSMLPNKNGGYYSNLDKIYARVKVWLDNDESPWYILPVVSQQDQNLIITENGKPDIHVNTITDNIKTYEGY